MDVFNELKKAKLISIMRGVPVNEVVDTVRAIRSGGITCVEVTFNASKNDHSDTLQSIELI